MLLLLLTNTATVLIATLATLVLTRKARATSTAATNSVHAHQLARNNYCHALEQAVVEHAGRKMLAQIMNQHAK